MIGDRMNTTRATTKKRAGNVILEGGPAEHRGKVFRSPAGDDIRLFDAEGNLRIWRRTERKDTSGRGIFEAVEI